MLITKCSIYAYGFNLTNLLQLSCKTLLESIGSTETVTDQKTNSTIFKPIPETEDAVAVAIQKPLNRISPPKVIAGGTGKVAEQILAVAFQQGIKVREDADLAELLGAIKVDSEIPIGAFTAVAEILAYLYLLNDELNDLEKENNKHEPPNDEAIHSLANELIEKWTKLEG